MALLVKEKKILDEREEEVMRKLSHPNVIRLLDSQEDGEFQ